MNATFARALIAAAMFFTLTITGLRIAVIHDARIAAHLLEAKNGN